ncbi:MAG TPA: amidohydrolase [Gemmatimonadaceae bacterium]|nr:amidohydrolase [Gemmatimonadaceae bacterium]
MNHLSLATTRRTLAGAALLASLTTAATAQGSERLYSEIDRRAREIEQAAITWRRDFHRNPELSNRETRTARIIAEHLRSLGLEVQTGVAHTGVVGILRGGRPGPVVALRSDMDALPVTEEVDVPFRSTVRTNYGGQEVGVMHACGHDMHMAILMGVAAVLTPLRNELPGTVKFIFQPAEEGPPLGEEGGAPLMIAQGVLDNPRVDAIFGLHVFPFEVGKIAYRPGGLMASGDNFYVTVHGRQTHGALPWNGIDPIVAASQIVLGLQTLVSRQTDLTLTPAVVTVGSFRGGVRTNIVPDSVELSGTIRTFDERVRAALHEKLERTVQSIAAASGARATVRIQKMVPVTYNDPSLTERMLPTLRRVLGPQSVTLAQQTTTAEDFAWYQQKVPGMFFFLGITPKGQDPSQAAPNHSPRFYADEGAIVPGIRAMANLAVDFLAGQARR